MPAKVKSTTTIFIIIAIVITLQLARWQIFSYSNWNSQTLDRTQTQTIPSQRGKILASDGTILAIDQQIYGLYINKLMVKDMPGLADQLSGPLNMNPQDILSKTDNPKATYFSITHDILPDAKKLIDDVVAHIPSSIASSGSVVVSDEVKRYYPNNELAAQVIGFTTPSDDHKTLSGKYGIESSWDGILQGTKGYEKTILDRGGKAILTDDLKSINAKNGTDIQLSLNAGIESVSEKILKKYVNDQNAKSGSVIIVNPKNGEILSMANYPTFDPNKYYEGEIIDCNISRYKLNEKCLPTPTPTPSDNPTEAAPTISPTPLPKPVVVDTSAVYRNNALSRLFEAGSIIKGLTVSTAIEQKAFDANTMMSSHPGCENLLEDKIICVWDHAFKPARTLKDAVADSDNLAMKEIAFKLGKETLFKYFSSFGIGVKVDPNLDGEETTSLKAPIEMNILDLATMSFGQGFEMSPLQAVQAYVALAENGNKIHLHIIKSFENGNKDINFTTESSPTLISPDTAKQARDILKYAVMHSTVKNQLNELLKRYDIAGKTGTAQIANLNGPGYVTDKVNTTYIGMSPVDDPQVLMLVTLEGINGRVLAGSTAVPMWGEIATQVFPLMGVRAK